MSQSINVAVGVIYNDQGEVLIAQRARHKHQGNCWEFPGGKCEAAESSQQALTRELAEELGIQVRSAEPLINLTHKYPDQTVCLSVWRVTEYVGQPTGREGQAIRWCALGQLNQVDFPAANQAIIKALVLPDYCLVTPDAADYPRDVFLQRLQQLLAAGIELIQLRSHSLPIMDYLALAQSIRELLTDFPTARLLLNLPLNAWQADQQIGLHLTRARLFSTEIEDLLAQQRPGLLSAACHNLADIQRAQTLDVDFILLSPVQKTASHPKQKPLGWQRFAELAAQAKIPIYAMGGLQPTDLLMAKQHGAQGIAAIRGFWQ